MYSSLQIIKTILKYNLTKDDVVNLKLVMKIIDSKKKVSTYNSVYNNSDLLKKIDNKIIEIDSIIENCLEIEKTDILFVLKNELILLKDDFLNEMKMLFKSIDKSNDEKRLVDSCIKTNFNGKANIFKKNIGSKKFLLGEKYEIAIDLLDNTFFVIENENLINEIKDYIIIKKELNQLKEKLNLYQLILEKKDTINQYKENKNIISMLNNEIKSIKQKIEKINENKKSLNGKISNLFSRRENNLFVLEKN